MRPACLTFDFIASIFSPEQCEPRHHLADSEELAGVRPEINIHDSFSPHSGLSKKQVPMKTIQHVLPRAYCIWFSQHNRSALYKGANTVRNQSVLGPIATPDYIPPPGRANRWIVVSKERIPIASRNDLGAGFACRIGIMSTQLIGLPIRPCPLLIVIHLVGCHHDYGLYVLN